MGLTPDYSVTAGGADITESIRSRLASLRLSGSLDGSADVLEMELDDPRNELAVPDPGREFAVSLGYRETGLTEMGVYVHVESVVDFAPAKLTVRAAAADVSRAGQWKSQRTRAWHDLTLGDVVSAIASDHGVQARVEDTLAAEAIAHIDQTAESDLHLLRRLADHYGAAVQIGSEYLVFAPESPAETAGSGSTIEPLPIAREAIERATLTQEDRSRYGTVRAIYHDVGQNAYFGVTAGEGEPVYELRDPYPDHARATAAAAAMLARLTRRTSSLSATVQGNPVLVAGGRIRIPSWPQAAGRTWSVTRAEHVIRGSRGYSTTVDAEAV